MTRAQVFLALVISAALLFAWHIAGYPGLAGISNCTSHLNDLIVICN